MTLAERRAMLFSPHFWRILSRQMPPFDCDYEDQMLEALARSTRVSLERVEAHYLRYLKARMAITDGLAHPGSNAIH